MRICSGSGCLRAVPDDVRYCDECNPTLPVVVVDGIREHTQTDRERYSFLYSSPRWQRLRRLVIQRQPMCARCDRAISEIVDHIVPAGVAIAQALGRIPGGRYVGFFLMSNLQGLCRGCHYTKTIEDKGHIGAWPDVVVIEAQRTPRRFSF